MASSNIRPPSAFTGNDKLPDFQPVLNDLQTTAQQQTPSGTAYYKNVVVLAINFKTTDLVITPSRDRLLKTFVDMYHYKVEQYEIHENASSGLAAQSVLFTWIANKLQKYAGSSPTSKTLFILFYSGHGLRFDNGTSFHRNDFVLYARWPARPPHLLNTQPGPYLRYYINWTKISSALTGNYDSNCNELVAILDCCDSGVAHIGDDIELLGASAWNTTASGDELDNFTTDLNHVLLANHGDPKTIADLYEDICYRAKVMKYPRAQAVHRKSHDQSRCSVVIKPLVKPKLLPPIIRHAKRLLITMAITIQQENTVPSADQLKEWLLKNIPASIKNINFKAKWKSASVTVLLTVPVQIWLFLPDRPQYKYVAHEWTDDYEE